jgi:antirestriction protein ArdC
MPKAKAKRPLTKRQKFAKQFTPEERKNWKNNTVTDAIIKAIDKGVPEWRKPWRTMRSEGMQTTPQNGFSGRAYRGVNFFLAAASGFSDLRFFSLKQIGMLGGTIKLADRKQYMKLVLWLPGTTRVKDTDTGEWKNKKTMYMRLYNVWNISQVEWPQKALDKLKVDVAKAPTPPPADINAIGKALNISTRYGGDSAFYQPVGDYVAMPTQEQFTTSDHFISTHLHEFIHATGAGHRLKREFGKRFGDHAYAAEELVAELGSVFLSLAFNVNCELEHHASYLHHWRNVMKADNRAIITAASAAQKAADYVLEKMGMRQPVNYNDDAEPADDEIGEGDGEESAAMEMAA